MRLDASICKSMTFWKHISRSRMRNGTMNAQKAKHVIVMIHVDTG
jgi:hypothetical protein